MGQIVLQNFIFLHFQLDSVHSEASNLHSLPDSVHSDASNLHLQDFIFITKVAKISNFTVCISNKVIR